MKKILKMTLITFIMLIGMNSVGATDCSSITDMARCNGTAGCIVYTDSRTHTAYCGEKKQDSSTSTNNATKVHVCNGYDNVEACNASLLNCIWSDSSCKPVASTKTVTCGDFESIPTALPVFSSNIVTIVKIVTPILLVILGMIDFAKAMMSNDEKTMKESQNKFVKRLIGAVAVFIVVAVIQFIFNIIGTESTNAMASCINCFLNNTCNTSDQVKLCNTEAAKQCKSSCSASYSYDTNKLNTCIDNCKKSKADICELKYGDEATSTNVCFKCKDEGSTSYVWYNKNPGKSKACSSGYDVVNLTESECKSQYLKYACYKCRISPYKNKWDLDGQSDASCAAGYDIQTQYTNEDDCLAANTGYACYVCKGDSSIYSWAINGGADSACADGYSITNIKIKSECLSAGFNYSCYVCKDDSSIKQWTINPGSGGGCNTGYVLNKSLSESECR